MSSRAISSRASPAPPNGASQQPAITTDPTQRAVGINFGNSYASIAVLGHEGLPECIANEDGERQIACAIAFHGQEMYIGNQAKQQLVKNAQNTITGFRNVLGKKFSELSQEHDHLRLSTPLIQHPDHADEPAYKVHTGDLDSPTERILTVSEVTTIFLKSLLQSAADYLGSKVEGAVLTVPAWFDEHQRKALIKAAEDAGVKVLQLLDEAGAAALASDSSASEAESGSTLAADRTVLVVDLGASALELSLLALRQGVPILLAESMDRTIGGDRIDDQLIRFFAKDFTKKTKTPLAVCPAKDNADKRAEAKLRLALEHTKRTLSASPGAATCAVESLKDGLDYTGTINRLRCDMELRAIYTHVGEQVKALLKSAGLDGEEVDEVVYVGGSASLPGLDESLAEGLAERVHTPFSAGTVVGGGSGDPTTVLARGCALQARLIAKLTEEDEELAREAFGSASERWTSGVKATKKTIGLVFPSDNGGEMGGTWVVGVRKDTVIPCRRIVVADVDLGANSKKLGFEVWQVSESVKIDKVTPAKLARDDDDDDDDEEEEEMETKERIVSKDTLLAAVAMEAKHARQEKGGKRWRTNVEVRFFVGADGQLEVDCWELGAGGEKGSQQSVRIAAP